jgi:hypothetical protein
MELRETFKIGEEPAAAAPPPPPEPEPEPEPPEPVPEVPEIVLDPDEAVVRILSEEDRQDAEKVSSVQKIYRMNMKEKLITALKGSREERAILIRDPNNIVAQGVLGSPRLGPAEVESISAMKNVSGEVLRTIGSHREWTKNSNVISNLVKNPRTPIGLCNVPEAIRKQALKFVRKKQ